ncbi:hypothetical protein KC360_g209 [Hortaea werneckii]|nr:hypothetical protein KC360_g209 [Hortaea werneckii]
MRFANTCLSFARTLHRHPFGALSVSRPVLRREIHVPILGQECMVMPLLGQARAEGPGTGADRVPDEYMSGLQADHDLVALLENVSLLSKGTGLVNDGFRFLHVSAQIPQYPRLAVQSTGFHELLHGRPMLLTFGRRHEEVHCLPKELTLICDHASSSAHDVPPNEIIDIRIGFQQFANHVHTVLTEGRGNRISLSDAPFRQIASIFDGLDKQLDKLTKLLRCVFGLNAERERFRRVDDSSWKVFRLQRQTEELGAEMDMHHVTDIAKNVDMFCSPQLMRLLLKEASGHILRLLSLASPSPASMKPRPSGPIKNSIALPHSSVADRNCTCEPFLGSQGHHACRSGRGVLSSGNEHTRKPDHNCVAELEGTACKIHTHCQLTDPRQPLRTRNLTPRETVLQRQDRDTARHCLAYPRNAFEIRSTWPISKIAPA